MSYQIDLLAIRESFKFNEAAIRHNPNKRSKFLPYTSKFDENKVKDFSMVLGEFFRLIEGQKTESNINFDDIIKELLTKVTFNREADKEHFISVVRSIFQTEDNLIYNFHPYIYLYLTSDTETRKMAKFLYDVLLQDYFKEENNLRINFEPADVLSKLIVEVLPKLENYHSKENSIYHCAIPQISKLFQEDFKWLIENPNLFLLHAEKLLKYYYFFYVSQFSLFCQRFLDDEQKISPVYFNLEWENISSNRISYEYGWKRIEAPISSLFSHINCLEFLNHKKHSSKVYFYNDIAVKLRDLDTASCNELTKDLEDLIDQYKQKLSDTVWDDFKFRDMYDSPVKNTMYKLYKVIDYQFNQVSSRRSQYNRYQEWFVSFSQRNFIKLRGRLGRTLKLSPEYLLFITKVIIKDDSKIRLKKLFDGFSDRGIIFDRDTQNHIIKYFEAINIIEKKSDSGDAIYVKSFL